LPKFASIAADVARSREKTVVLVARASGYRALLAVMQRAAALAKHPFRVVTMDQLSEFNAESNLKGKEALILVADASQCSEGVSFKAVRRLFLADVPSSAGPLQQMCGRANRMLGHQGLLAKEQAVSNQLIVATLPKWAKEPLGAWVLRIYCLSSSDGREAERKATWLYGKLKEVGIKTLADLKKRVDKAAGIGSKRKAPTEQIPLSPPKAAKLVQDWGLESLAVKMAKGDKSQMGGRTRKRPQTLFWALQTVCRSNVDKLAASLALETVDELSLRQLAEDTKRKVPALAKLRSEAIRTCATGTQKHNLTLCGAWRKTKPTVAVKKQSITPQKSQSSVRPCKITRRLRKKTKPCDII